MHRAVCVCPWRWLSPLVWVSVGLCAVSGFQAEPVSAQQRPFYVTVSGDIAFGNAPQQTFSRRQLPTAVGAVVTESESTFNISTGTGYALNVAVGYKFPPLPSGFFRAEVEFSYFNSPASFSAKGVTSTTVGSNTTVTTTDTIVRTTFQNYAVMVNGYYEFYTDSFVRPYLGFGFGYNNFSTDNIAFEGVGQVVGTPQSLFAIQARAGVILTISETLDALIGYRFFSTSDLSSPAFSTFSQNLNNIELGLRLNF
jgi:opacity protein-like surface antigen